MSDWGARLTPLEDLVIAATDDWVHPGMAWSVAMECSGLTDHAAIRSLAIGLVAEAIVDGSLVAGELGGDGFRAWECSTDFALGRIVEQWVAWGLEGPTPGAICWLATTPKGETFAREALDRARSAT